MGLFDKLHSWNPMAPNGLNSLFGGGGGGGNKQESMASAAANWDPNYAWGLHSGSSDPTKFAPGAKTLYDILGNPGQTDSRLFNMGLASNARNTQLRQDEARGTYARSGLQNSGLAMAMNQAIGSAGQNREAKMQAEEARRKEDLKRQDLQLLYQFILEPSMQRYAADRGVSLAQSQSKDTKNAAYAGSAAALIGGLAAAFCHVADELYGYASEKAMLSRYYMARFADDETLDLYNGVSSRKMADRIKTDRSLRAEVAPIFDNFVEVAKGDFPRREWQH
jgi:hypothetical protein